jgi:hypothetical protein
MKMLSIWAIRLAVLKIVPVFLRWLSNARDALDAGYEAIRLPAIVNGEQRLDEEIFAVMAENIQQRVTAAGRIMDQMLDALEGREDVLPDKWIGELEDIEEGVGNWEMDAERVVLEGRLREVSKAEEFRAEREKMQLVIEGERVAEAAREDETQIEDVLEKVGEIERGLMEALEAQEDVQEGIEFEVDEPEPEPDNEPVGLGLDKSLLKRLREVQASEIEADRGRRWRRAGSIDGGIPEPPRSPIKSPDAAMGRRRSIAERQEGSERVSFFDNNFGWGQPSSSPTKSRLSPRKGSLSPQKESYYSHSPTVVVEGFEIPRGKPVSFEASPFQSVSPFDPPSPEIGLKEHSPEAVKTPASEEEGEPLMTPPLGVGELPPPAEAAIVKLPGTPESVGPIIDTAALIAEDILEPGIITEQPKLSEEERLVTPTPAPVESEEILESKLLSEEKENERPGPVTPTPVESEEILDARITEEQPTAVTETSALIAEEPELSEEERPVTPIPVEEPIPVTIAEEPQLELELELESASAAAAIPVTTEKLQAVPQSAAPQLVSVAEVDEEGEPCPATTANPVAAALADDPVIPPNVTPTISESSLAPLIESESESSTVVVHDAVAELQDAPPRVDAQGCGIATVEGTGQRGPVGIVDAQSEEVEKAVHVVGDGVVVGEMRGCVGEKVEEAAGARENVPTIPGAEPETELEAAESNTDITTETDEAEVASDTAPEQDVVEDTAADVGAPEEVVHAPTAEAQQPVASDVVAEKHEVSIITGNNSPEPVEIGAEAGVSPAVEEVQPTVASEDVVEKHEVATVTENIPVEVDTELEAAEPSEASDTVDARETDETKVAGGNDDSVAVVEEIAADVAAPEEVVAPQDVVEKPEVAAITRNDDAIAETDANISSVTEVSRASTPAVAQETAAVEAVQSAPLPEEAIVDVEVEAVAEAREIATSTNEETLNVSPALEIQTPAEAELVPSSPEQVSVAS